MTLTERLQHIKKYASLTKDNLALLSQIKHLSEENLCLRKKLSEKDEIISTLKSQVPITAPKPRVWGDLSAQDDLGSY